MAEGAAVRLAGMDRQRLHDQVLVGFKERLLAPELLQVFVRSFVDEVNAANLERGARRKELESELGQLERQAWNLLGQLKEGHGSPAMAAELREVEARYAPEAAADAALIAGHPMAVSLKHYAEATSRHAGLRHARRIARLRRATEGIARRAWEEA